MTKKSLNPHAFLWVSLRFGGGLVDGPNCQAAQIFQEVLAGRRIQSRPHGSVGGHRGVSVFRKSFERIFLLGGFCCISENK